MSYDPERLARALARGPFTRVIVARTEGSVPREIGAEMWVWPDHVEGTIGGGRLEFEAIARARTLRAAMVERIPLGPAMGQCCGGAVSLLHEPVTAVVPVQGPLRLRPLAAEIDPDMPMPLAVHRAVARARDRGAVPPLVIEGWIVEPVTPSALPVWVWGAGHVGRALIEVMAPLPGLSLSWADMGEDRFPAPLPPHLAHVRTLAARNPADLVSLAPRHARHYILTYSHALDLELCHRLLTHGAGFTGLIGSATKWARFRSRLHALGHAEARIGTITCPIGDPGLGKHPQAIAVSVVAALLKDQVSAAQQPEDVMENPAAGMMPGLEGM